MERLYVPVLPYTIYANRMNPQHLCRNNKVDVLVVFLLVALCDLSLPLEDHYNSAILCRPIEVPFSGLVKPQHFLERDRLTFEGLLLHQ
jgi:hypothetical protein